MMKKAILGIIALCSMTISHALEVKFEAVAQGVYAHIGDIGGRTTENEGLNANIGLVVTPAGAVLIDSGASYASAKAIHEAVKRITPQPVRWVINTGGQDHRWLGNGYFKEQGAEVIAHAAAAADMRVRSGDQLAALRPFLGDKLQGTAPVYPARLVDTNDLRLELGGRTVELLHRGGGHTPGDMMVWLPDVKVLFSGDIVYVDRLLAVIPVSNTRQWLVAFAEVEKLNPTRIVPGHGHVTDLATAKAHTRDYLQALRTHMKDAVERNEDISLSVRRFDLSPFKQLANADDLHPGNASRTYLEVERE
jgi:glyoxylase-like metal-dependent hydrolase (beta-lactamase superfamily II)